MNVGNGLLRCYAMFLILEVSTVFLVAVAMALALAHALEMPGKMRLSKDDYLAMQPIYYPGFTIGGIAEPAGLVLLLLLVILTPFGGVAFWLASGAFAALLAMHAAYWLLTHPVNNFWLEGVELKGAGAGFFAFDPLNRKGESREVEWTRLRDRWERSHVFRAGLGALSLILLVSSIAH